MLRAKFRATIVGRRHHKENKDRQMDELAIEAQRAQRLRWVRWVAVLDLLLLVALVAASRMGNRQLVAVLGPIHGGNFLLLLTMTATGAADGLWSWWFPGGVLVTGGPIGALIGEWLILRRTPKPADTIIMKSELRK
jgi:hypothetical protein